MQLIRKKIYVVIPVYNEERIISSVIREVIRFGYKKIIVVDDGSQDDSYKKILENDIIALRHAANRGKGAAIQTGLEAAKRFDAEYVVIMDGDGQHDPRDISRLENVLNQGIDVVLGYRSFKSSEIPSIKKLYNCVGNIFTLVLCGLWVKDSQSGLRAFSKHALQIMSLRSDRYEHESEVIWEIHKKKLRYKEIPIHVRYTQYSQSKPYKQNLINGVKTLIKIMLLK
jgi:glycosyltransferase involved in cell wall biosynthesis